MEFVGMTDSAARPDLLSRPSRVSFCGARLRIRLGKSMLKVEPSTKVDLVAFVVVVFQFVQR